MLPIAKAGVLLVLLGAGATGTCALAGGFGSGNGEGTQKENAVEGSQKPNGDVVGISETTVVSNPQGGTDSSNPTTNQGTTDLAGSQADGGSDVVAETPLASSDTARITARATDGQLGTRTQETSGLENTESRTTPAGATQPVASSSTTIAPSPSSSQTPSSPSGPSVTTTQETEESA